MSVEIIQGESKDLIARLMDGTTGDPYDLTGVKFVKACFVNTDQSSLNVFFLKLTGDTTNLSTTISNIDTTNLVVGSPISGAGIPVGATVVSITDPLNVVISAAATATAVGVAITSGDISILSALLGKIKISLRPAQTTLMESGASENFEVTVNKNGSISIIQFPGALNVVERFC